MFVKTGSENYMLGKVNFPIQEVDQLTIVVCHHKLTFKGGLPVRKKPVCLFLAGPAYCDIEGQYFVAPAQEFKQLEGA